jgi:hypothetical protein
VVLAKVVRPCLAQGNKEKRRMEAGMRWNRLTDELTEGLRNGFRQIAW